MEYFSLGFVAYHGYLFSTRLKDYCFELLILVLMSFFPFVIVIFHPSEVDWLVAASWNRITTQALPLFLKVLIPFFSQGLAL
jgi:hypothetical protein